MSGPEKPQASAKVPEEAPRPLPDPVAAAIEAGDVVIAGDRTNEIPRKPGFTELPPVQQFEAIIRDPAKILELFPHVARPADAAREAESARKGFDALHDQTWFQKILGSIQRDVSAGQIKLADLFGLPGKAKEVAEKHADQLSWAQKASLVMKGSALLELERHLNYMILHIKGWNLS